MSPTINRRGFLTLVGLAICGIGVGLPMLQRASRAAVLREKSLSFHSLHSGEKLEVTYWVDGAYVAEALKQVNHILRDWRTDEIHPIDPSLLDYLFDLRRAMDSTAPFHVISGYRSRESNEMLRKQSPGVAKNSLHLRGRAIDVSLPGRDLAKLRKTAVAMRRGGVGYYPALGFVHVDTGRFRTW